MTLTLDRHNLAQPDTITQAIKHEQSYMRNVQAGNCDNLLLTVGITIEESRMDEVAGCARRLGQMRAARLRAGG